jgi:poly-gamma-glutamate capsule biosynthesis protein CapA/YwtB (metallophosphatase superfamily)
VYTLRDRVRQRAALNAAAPRCDRRRFLKLSAAATLSATGAMAGRAGPRAATRADAAGGRWDSTVVKLFLCGDVMTGRGIDQILPHPGKRELYEPYIRDAHDYVVLAERASGPLARPVAFDYVWGDALEALQRSQPDGRIVNLETAVTRSDEYWPGKGINYRMAPGNVPCLSAARIDCCVLANNHVLDWGYAGLAETLHVLHRASIRTVGAGAERSQAQQPAMLATRAGGHVIVFAFGVVSSGIPSLWAAATARPGVNLLRDFSPAVVRAIGAGVAAVKRRGDVVVASIHWGGNWGYEVSESQRRFARQLIDDAGVDLVHGHSSHHPKGIELYRGRLILYGCGDFLNDYEGIGGHERYRGDLSLMYLPEIDTATGRLARLRMVPFQVRQLRLRYASRRDANWLTATLRRESNVAVELGDDNLLVVRGDAG